MPIDPFMLTTIGFGLLAIGFWIKADKRYLQRQEALRRYHLEQAANWELRSELFHLKWIRDFEAARRRHIASQGGKAKAAKIKAEAPARRARTNDAIAHTAFRPREEVVADVLTNRRARNHLSAGVAAQRP